MSYFDNIGPIVTIPDCARQMDMSAQNLYQRLKSNQGFTQPPTFRAGGQMVMTKDNAAAWIEKHNAQWEALMASKKQQKEAV